MVASARLRLGDGADRATNQRTPAPGKPAFAACDNGSMIVESHSPGRAVKLLTVLALAAAIVVVLLATGWADDHAPAGSKGRVPVTYMPPADSR
jgi:hypothetical protein